MRAHPVFGDSLIAGLLLLLDLLLFVTSAGERPPPLWYVALPSTLAVTVPLALRRRYPVVVPYLLLLACTLHGSLELGASSLFATAIAVYTVLVYAGRRQGTIYLALTAAVGVAQTLLLFRDTLLLSLLPMVVALAFCWVLAEFVGARRAYQGELEARLHLLETERDQAARIAVAEERGRIARELHDVVAHAVSVMVVQADGASYAIRPSPDTAERAVRTISETGRGALSELRRLLDVLRDTTEEEDGLPRVPQPGTDALVELAERVRAAGLPVTLEVDLGDGEPELPAGVSLGVYRIVQESLTNALKHAGKGARATVAVHRAPDAVTVQVADDGAGRMPALATLLPGPDAASPGGAQAGTATGARMPGVPGGNGLIGMRERANVFGGTLTAGPAPGGGWQVRATLPLRTAT
ncbi:two-component sensor histidine kinase [Amycolatopsis antarctica]|uniref:histidine kinase n=1 Tax=Amycolatopsis antarctica TaxID=1854586 RepID=A0A263CZS1_9PSEU|nr:sensor histidine kinase [Amycolatopsis antarctica]OZM71378.1 two-component sensor histidine kinase [Amycolatopsis antarctica]